MRRRRNRRRLNLKGLLILLAGLVLVGVGAHFLHGYQVKRQTGSLLKQADRAESQKQYALAIDYLRRYLGFRPQETDILARYGRLLARTDMVTTPRAGFTAMAVLESVLRRDPTRQEERLLLVDLSLLLQNYKNAQYHLEFLLGVRKGQDLQQHLGGVLKEDRTKGELVGKLATSHAAQRHYLQARELYELAVHNVPGEVTNYVGLAGLLREQTDEVLRPSKDPKKRETPASLHQQADQLMDKLVTANPGSARSHLLRALYRRRYPLPAGREATLQAIERDLRQALKLASDDAEVLLSLADLAIDRNNTSEARELLMRGLAEHQRDWRMYQALARLELRLNRSDEALSHLRNGLTELPEQLELLWGYADLLVDIGSHEAPKALEQLQRKGFPQPEIDVLSARLLIRERKWAEALDLLVNAYPKLIGRTGFTRLSFLGGVAERCDFLLARCYEQLGDHYRAQNAYQRILAGNAQSIEGRLGVARTHVALGQGREAQSQYAQLARTNNGRALIELARLAWQRNGRQDNPDWDEVDEALQKAERLQPRPVEVVLLRAEALVAQGELARQRGEEKALEKAVEQARALLAAHLVGGMPVWTGLVRPEMLPVAALPPPRSLVPLWIGLSILEERAGHPTDALKILAEAGKTFGDLVELRQAQARYQARQGGRTAAEGLAALERNLDTFRPEERRQLRLSLALAWTRLGQPAQARRVWQELAKENPDDWTARLALFNLALQEKDNNAMDRLLEELHQIEKEDGVLWRDATVRRLLQQANEGEGDRSVLLRRARQLTAEIATRWPGWVGVTLYEAQLADLDGQVDQALLKYRMAIDRGGATVQAVWRAMQILNSQQRFREASALRRKLPSQGQFSAGLEQVAALASLQANDDAEALARAERAATRDAKDYRVHLLLAQIHWKAGQTDKALEALRTARDRNSRVPETWVGLISLLVAMGKKDQAQAELNRASKELTETKGRLALAQCYEALGDNAKAGEVYNSPKVANSMDLAVRRAVAAYHLRSGNAKAANQHLRFLVREAEVKEPQTVVWARGMLAVLAALGGNYTEMREALASMEKSGSPTTGAGVSGRRTQAALLATRGNQRDRRGAIRLLEGLIDGGVDQPPDRLLLAQLYEADNQWPKARKQLAILREMAGGSTGPILVAYVSAMLRHDEPEEAERALGQLEKTIPDTLAFLSLKARVWHRQGRKMEAVALLQDHARKQGAGFGQVAMVLEELKEDQAAEQMYKKHGEKSPNPSALLAYAGFLGRQKRSAEALDVCERAWVKAPPGLVASTCLGILEAAEDNKAIQARVERQFRAALRKDPQSVVLHHALANLLVLQRQYDNAEAAYRDLIIKDPRNALARNNLAWLLVCRKKKIAQAEELIDQAIALSGPRATLLDTRALVYLAAGKTKEAIRLLKELVAESAKVPGYHFHLAQAQLADRNRREAARSFERAQRVGLKLSTLHPLERQGYERLVQDLGIARGSVEE